MWRSIVATRRPTGSWRVCGPKLKNALLMVKDSSERVNRVQGRASNAAESSDARHDRYDARWCTNEPEQRLAVCQIDSAPLSLIPVHSGNSGTQNRPPRP